MRKNKGFTLIELLVVIAIIGILSAIVLASLNQARSKAQDGKIQSQLASMRAAAEIYYGSHGNSYGPPMNASGADNCSQLGNLFGNVESGMQNLASSTPNITCVSTNDQWAAAAPLVSDSMYSWCVDNTGVSRQVNSVSAGVPPVIDSINPACPVS